MTKMKLDDNSLEDSENFDEINPNLLKIIDKYQDKLTSITNTINQTEIIGYISFLVFLLMLTIRLSPNITFNWLILLAPSLTCLFSFTIFLNMFLKLKDLFDGAENFDEEEKNSSFGSILSYFCLNSISLCLLIFLILLFTRLQNIITLKLNEIAIPFYVLSGIVLFYYIFIFPAFIKNKMIYQIFMTGVYILGSFIFMVLINTKIDNNSFGLYSFIFIPIFIGISLHIAFYIYMIINSSKNNYLNLMTVLFSLLLLFSSLLLIALRLDDFINIYIWIPMVMLIFSFMLIVSDKLYNFFEIKGSEMKNEQFSNNNENNEKHF